MEKIDEKEKNEEKLNTHKLSHKYTFWFRISKNAFKKEENEYIPKNKKIAKFDSIEDFWEIYQHLKKPDNCQEGIELKMFKDNIEPKWDNDSNKNGGKMTLLCNKDYTSIIWEEIILNIIGNIFPKNILDNINGIIFCSKSKYNTIQIWFKEYNQDYCHELEQCIRDMIQIPKEVPINFKKFFNEDNKDINNNKKYHHYNNYKYSGYAYNKYKKNNNYNY